MSDMYRTRTMDQISEGDIGAQLKIAGWVENIRDHGGVSFIDLRDMYGVMQVVLRDTSLLDHVRKEECLSVEGVIQHRDEETFNPKIPTGTIELEAHKIDILGKVYRDLPFEIATSKEIREDVRLKYRYLDMRNRKVKDNILFRSKVIRFLREKMEDMGFVEVQTPILCASSPEGARDYVVPSRKYKGKFYALPQAPQQYKQLLMVSGIDKYYQIAPCFRDEDARADRSPGEFYQLDFEMAFATQEDVFKIGEEVLTETFKKFAPERSVITEAPYPIFSYKEAMLQFGSDKPDLRNPLRIIDVTDFFQRCTFKPFHGQTVRAINVHAKLSKGQHEKLLKFAQSIGILHLSAVPCVDDNLLTACDVEYYCCLRVQTQLFVILNFCFGCVVYNEIRLEVLKLFCCRFDEHVSYEMCLPSYLNDEADSHTGIFICTAECIYNEQSFVGELFFCDLFYCCPCFLGCRMVIVFVLIGSPPYSIFRILVHNDVFVFR